ncbi:MAG: O-antigen ligase family protein [Deltaproteobacteria bacterium]|nr:O-antigen ligase family protein [Deltaproteobacteria bacterium]
MTSATASAARPHAAALPRPRPRRSGGDDVPSKAAWWLFLLYLVLEFDRPPLIAGFKLQMLIAIVLPLIWLGAHERPWSRVLTAQALLLFTAGSMIPFAHNNYAAYFTTRMLFSNVTLAISMAWLFAGRSAFRRFYWAWLLVMSWVAVFGVTHGGRGPGGFLGDENDLALACVGAFPFAFYGFQLLPGWRRFLAGGCGVLLVLAVVASLSRGGFVGLVAALVYCFAVSAHKLRNFLLALVATGVFLALVPQSYVDEMSTIRNTDTGTADTRKFLWATAWNIFKAHPVLGVGGSNFNFVAGEYTPKDDPRWQTPDYQERNWSGTTVHSTYFQFLSELGLVGTSLYAVMVVGHFRAIGALRRSVRRRTHLPREVRNEIEVYAGALAGGMIGTLAAGAFLSAGYYPFAYFYTGAGVALVTWAARPVAAERQAAQVSEPG